MATESNNTLYFDPDQHPDDTLKAFVEIVQDYEHRYNASYPDPPKVSLEAAITRWKVANGQSSPTLEQYDDIVETWKGKDMVAKFVGIFSSRRLRNDWSIAISDDAQRKNASWSIFVKTMKAYYKPTENLSLKNFQFRSLSQNKDETFNAFCNRVEREAKHCQFKCVNDDCTAEATAVRDQILFGIISDDIREEGLKNSWELTELRKEGMRLESAAKGASEISGEVKLNRVGKYSLKHSKTSGGKKNISCYFCGLNGPRQEVLIHAKQCSAKTSICENCNKSGHSQKVCKEQPVKLLQKQVETHKQVESENQPLYNINLFRVTDERLVSKNKSNDFKVQLLVNNHLDTVLADTGAGISVCGLKTARKWNLLDKMCDSKVRIKPYNSDVISTEGVSTCGVSFGDRTIPVQWYIIKDSCEPILAGKMAEHLGIIEFKNKPNVIMPINMIEFNDNRLKEELQNVIASIPELFNGLGCMKNHVVSLPTNGSVKPVAEPPRRVPYHLVSRVNEIVNGMLKDGVIEAHPSEEHAPWVSNLVIVPKPDGGLRVTLDATNVNKALLSSNFPIPRQEDIKAKLSGKKIFSKLDLKSAFWQLEIDPKARHMTVFHSGGRLYRYKRLVMGLKPSQGELNAALQPLFSHLPDVHVIHDDIIIATTDELGHIKVIKDVLKSLLESGVTLNGDKCTFGAKQIKFWGLLVTSEGVCPDPEKVEALEHLTTPTNKEELISFLCMMQSNADFIIGFSKKAALLRELTRKNIKFQWEEKHESCFRELLASFKKDVLLRYFDPHLQTFIFVDGHITGLGAMLAQGQSIDNAKPVAIASRSTSLAEKNYPQLDIEAASLDFGLRRFREYLVGSPFIINVVTDHKPLVNIFNGNRNGSIRTQRIKLKHQDIPYIVQYQKGSLNQVDYLSRRARNLSTLPVEQQNEAQELNNLLYTLHSTPIIDHISIKQIAQKTESDAVLKKVRDMVKSGKKPTNKENNEKVKKFIQILPELTVTTNGILLKGERMVLPESLQDTAIQLAHRGSHPGRSGIERRLRYHFFFHSMYEKVKQFIQQCKECSLFVDKKTKEPLKHHKIPKKSWETVAVDLFGPMPTSQHVVVVQDIGSRYPAAKLVSSTKANQVIPALDDIYAEYGYPDTQISDNGPPFNSKSMQQFMENHDITAQFSTPYHPSQNPAETFMKTVGKTMKAANYSKESEARALRDALVTYRQTPHISTGVPPANFIFRDGIKTQFPRRTCSNKDIIKESRKYDHDVKQKRERVINDTKYRKTSAISEGDVVLARDCTKSSKFDPVFLPDPFVVINCEEEASRVILEGLRNPRVIVRHLDDVKECYSQTLMQNSQDEDESVIMEFATPISDKLMTNPLVEPFEMEVEGPRRSSRQRVAPNRYPEDEWTT